MSGGSNTVKLVYPEAKDTTFWKLAYKNWFEEKINETTYNSVLERTQKINNNGIANYNPLVWVPKNQIALLRSKLSQFNYKTQIKSALGTKANSWIFSAWGEGFLTHGWIGGVSFYIAADVYKRATGYDVERLKEWVRKYTPKDSPTKKEDPDKQKRSKLEVWMDLSLYTSTVIKSDRKTIYEDIYK